MTPRDPLGRTAPVDGIGTPPIPVILAIRDPSRERPLLRAAGEGNGTGFRLVGRVLDAAGLIEQVARRHADAVVVSPDLPGLSAAVLSRLRAAGLAVLVLPADGETLPADWEALGVRTLAEPVDAAMLTLALRRALAQRDAIRPSSDPERETAGEPRGAIVALFSGKGSPGRTTIATNLAVGLARTGQRVALVDADLSGGDVAAYLGLHPRANLFTLAHAVRGHRDLPETVVAPEFQTGAGDERLRVLVGLPRPGMAEAITVPFLEALLRYLRGRFPISIVDLAAPLPAGPDAATRAVLAQADWILVVCGGDLLAAWHCQQALVALRQALGEMPASRWLALNRHDRAWQPAPHEMVAALDWPDAPLATIPFDHGAMQAALRDQRPLLDTRRPVSRALEALARRVQQELSAPAPAEADPRATGKAPPGGRPWFPFARRSR